MSELIRKVTERFPKLLQRAVPVLKYLEKGDSSALAHSKPPNAVVGVACLLLAMGRSQFVSQFLLKFYDHCRPARAVSTNLTESLC